jgi:hypothetical protein
MNTLFTKPTRLSVSILVIFWIILIILAMFTSGCRSKKTNKESTQKETLVSNTTKSSSRDSSDFVGMTFKKNVEVVKDSSGSFTKKTTEFYEPTEKVPPGSPKKVTEEKWESGKKVKNVETEVDEFSNHSEIKQSESENSKLDLANENTSSKQDERKPNTIKNWIGAGLFVVILLFAGYYAFFRK